MEPPSVRRQATDFSPPLQRLGPSHQDWIYRLASDAVKSYNRSSLLRFLSPIKICKIRDSLNNVNRYGNQTGVCAVKGTEIYARVPLKLKPRDEA